MLIKSNFQSSYGIEVRMDASIVEKVVEKHLKLLRIEADAEKDEQNACLKLLSKRELQQRGVALFNVQYDEQKTGLGGKTIVQFSNPNVKVLPAHKMKVGDVVRIDIIRGDTSLAKDKDDDEPPSGVVSRVNEGSISVAFKDTFPVEYNCGGLRITKLANEVAFERCRNAMQELSKTAKKSPSPLIERIFGQNREFSVLFPADCDFLLQDTKCWYSDHLNEPQKLAIIKALITSDLSIIHGPPGTGKTETLIEIIRQLTQPRIFKEKMKPQRVLVCGPSNMSVDNIVERLSRVKDANAKRLDMVRLGHPARMLESVQPFGLDQRLSSSDDAKLSADIQREIDALLKSLTKPGVRRGEVYATLRDLRKELRHREKQSMQRLLDDCPVILSTLNMAGSSLLRQREFDVVIVDEAGQSLEGETWIALLRAKKAILAGDHLQLPPVVCSPEAEKGGLGVTLFERLCSKMSELVSMLTIQYRMNSIIMDWTSKEFYGGKLTAHSSVADHRISQLSGVKVRDPIEENDIMVFVDTAGFDFNEAQGADDESKYNEGEAKIVIQCAESLIACGIKPCDIAIITPYNAQVDLIRSLFENSTIENLIEVGSVDGFQGREKEAVIISFVRSNDAGDIGFLSEVRRTNVAITRARRYVCLIGDSSTLEKTPFYQRLVPPCDFMML